MYRDMYRNKYKNKHKSTYGNKCENKYGNRIIIECCGAKDRMEGQNAYRLAVDWWKLLLLRPARTE